MLQERWAGGGRVVFAVGESLSLSVKPTSQTTGCFCGVAMLIDSRS